MTPSRALLWLTWAIAALSTVAAAAGLFWIGDEHSFSFTTARGHPVEMYGRGLYRYDSLLVGAGFTGVDMVTLITAIPVLLIAGLMYQRGSLRGGVLLIGTLAYFLYNYASMSFGAAYNSLFLVYVALFSASGFALILAARSIDVPALPEQFSASFPRRGIAVYLFAVALLLVVVWGIDIVSAMLLGNPPNALGSYTTVVTYVLDLGVIAPLAVASGVLLLCRKPVGYLLAAAMLALNLTIGLALMAQGTTILLAGVAMTLGEIIGFIASFAMLTIVGIALLIQLVRSMPDRVLSSHQGRAA